jgi:hypothetical protein
MCGAEGRPTLRLEQGGDLVGIAGGAQWTRVQDALETEVGRVTSLLRTVRKPTAPAVGRWSAADVAMHLSQTWLVIPGLAGEDRSQFLDLVPGLEGDGVSFLSDLWQLPAATVLGVQADGERDLGVLADRIDQRAAAFLATLRESSPLDVRPWLVEGTKVRLSLLACHLLNETMVHGYDVARADRRRLPIDRGRAALVFEEFLIPIMQVLDPRALVDQGTAAGLRIVYELQLRGGGRYLFAFDDGALTVEPSGSPGRRIDCHISADPAALLLVAWARQSQWAAIARGQLVAWGRRPWLGPRLRALMRNP